MPSTEEASLPKNGSKSDLKTRHERPQALPHPRTEGTPTSPHSARSVKTVLATDYTAKVEAVDAQQSLPKLPQITPHCLNPWTLLLCWVEPALLR